VTYLKLQSNLLPLEYDQRHQADVLSGNALASYWGSARFESRTGRLDVLIKDFLRFS
jgi:hypothetical protein